MKIISILNHKGGVGKTTFCGSVAQALALSGYRVLAIDNDSQHNLSTLLGVGVKDPGMREVYLATAENAPRVFLSAIRQTPVVGLHCISSSISLREADCAHAHALRNILQACTLERFYEYVLIDNAPGLDRLQECAIAASNELFVPTELKQFAINGLAEMEQEIVRRFPEGARITRIIPNFYRETRRQQSYVAALKQLFGDRVTQTAIPQDAVFDELVTNNKILFIHRLFSRAAAYYLKIIHELFNLDEKEVWQQLQEKRLRQLGDEARSRLVVLRAKKLS